MILVAGASGQLGTALLAEGERRGLAMMGVGRPAFDFADPTTLKASFQQTAPHVVVNAAAYTAVDKAEDDLAGANAANCAGPAQLAGLCEMAGVPLVHVSTDYVFDGTKGAPYVETDATSPAGVYGTTKRDGELAVLAACSRAIILRTSWVYSAHGKNFVRTMLSAARRTNQLRVVADQVGTPTAAPDLASGILDIIGRWHENGWHESDKGIYHATGSGETSWYGFALALFEAAAQCGLTAPSITPIATADWPTPARRPADSRLDCGKLERIFGVRLPAWQHSLPAIVAKLMALDAPR